MKHRTHLNDRTTPYGVVALIVALAFATLSCLAFFSSTLEDALITFRYSERWSEGYAFGMWNRVGEPVEGFTTFLWMVLVSTVGPEADAMANFAKFLGFASYIGLVVFFFALYRVALRSDGIKIPTAAGDPTVFAFASLATGFAIGLCPPLAWYAMTGMETVPFALLVALSVFAPLVTSRSSILAAIAICITLIRPEGILVAVATSTFWFLMTRERLMFWVLGAALITASVLIAFRVTYFGVPLPNTYYAKAGGPNGIFHFKSGIWYFVRAAALYWMITLPMAGLLLARLFLWQRLTPMLWFLLASQMAFVILIARAGGDNLSAFPAYRHVLILFPLLFMTTFLLIGYLPKVRGVFLFAFVFCLMITSGVRLPFYGELASFAIRAKAGLILQNRYNDADFIHWLSGVTDDETVIASGLGGAIPFIVDSIHIDTLGLNDSEIAHQGTFDPYGPVDSKTSMSLVLDHSPDFIDGYMRASDMLWGDPSVPIFAYRAKMNIELLSASRFRENYLMVSNAPYESFNSILFVRRDWLEGPGINSGVEAVSLERVLSAFDNSDNPKKAQIVSAEE
ncbi:hypothetical protein N9B84_06125 [Amylibacter sp.]|nr:hypothetical protein [Amylibacter sp.]